MHYGYEIVVLPSNFITNPVLTPMKFSTGIIEEVEITFPDGCNDTIRCQLYDGSVQVLPTNEGGFYAANGRTIVAKPYYDLRQLYNTLVFVAWTIGSSYLHTLHVEFHVRGVDEPDLSKIALLQTDQVSRLVDLIKQL